MPEGAQIILPLLALRHRYDVSLFEACPCVKIAFH